MDTPCCNACYNSHGDCLEKNDCLCHAEHRRDLRFSTNAERERVLGILATGDRYADAHAGEALTFEGGALVTSYPEGRVVARPFLAARSMDRWISLTFSPAVVEA